MSEEIILIEKLAKRFDTVEAVKDISFSVREGEIFGFLGPNGAGKSTTIKILSTLLKPTSGNAALAGFDVVKQPNQVRQAIGIVFQDPSLDNRLTAEENLRFHGMLYNVPRRVLRERMDMVLRMVQLTERENSLVKTFSGGMKRRLEIARGLLHYPKVLFLDEPTVGLDPQTRNAIWEHINSLRDQLGITVFMTTHYMDEAEHCDRIAIIDNGEIQALDTPHELKHGLGGDKVIINGVPELEAELRQRYHYETLKFGQDVVLMVPEGASFIPKVITDFPGKITSIQVKEPSLDDVFLKLTGRAIREEEVGAKEQMKQNARRRSRR